LITVVPAVLPGVLFIDFHVRAGNAVLNATTHAFANEPQSGRPVVLAPGDA
jgi:hypothetical protein